MRSCNHRLLALLLAAPFPVQAQDAVELARAGVPALSRAWSGPDYRQLIAAVAEGKIALPRLSDPSGAAIFRRAVSDENLDACRNRSVAIQGRLLACTDVMGAVVPLLNAYLAAVGTKAPLPHEELAHLIAYLVQVSGLAVELVDEFLPNVPRDETYPARLEGLKKMRSGLTSVVMGAEASLAEAAYTEQDRSVMLEALATSFPKVQSALAPDVVIDLRGRLERHRPRFTGADSARLEGLIQRVVELEKAQADAAKVAPAMPAKPASP